MNKMVISFLVIVSFIVVSAVPAFAGDKQRHRWQGVAMGIGAAILGQAIFNADNSSGGKDCRRPPRRHHPPVVYGNNPVYQEEFQREQARIAREQRRVWEQAERERARRDAQRAASGYGYAY